MAYLLVKHPKKNTETTVVRSECLQDGTVAIGQTQKIYVGKTYEDLPPPEVLKVNNKTATFSGPGFYWRLVGSQHGM